MLRPDRAYSAASLAFVATRTRRGNTLCGSLSAIWKRLPLSNDERCAEAMGSSQGRFLSQSPVAHPVSASQGMAILKFRSFDALAEAVEPFVIDAQGFAALLQFQQFAIHGVEKFLLVLGESDADILLR